MSEAKALLLWVRGLREKWYLQYVVGPKSIQNTDEYLCNFSVPRGGVEKAENVEQKNRNADKGAHGYARPRITHRIAMMVLVITL